MLITIIFFFALLITLVVITDFIEDSPEDHIYTRLTLRVIFCLLWWWLFYLLH